MRYAVEFKARAQYDLRNLERYLASRFHPGDAEIYVEALVGYCMTLSTFPERGSARPEIGYGVRLTGYKGEISILFRINRPSALVSILRIGYRGRVILP